MENDRDLSFHRRDGGVGYHRKIVTHLARFCSLADSKRAVDRAFFNTHVKCKAWHTHGTVTGQNKGKLATSGNN